MIVNHAQPCPTRDQNLPGSPPSYYLVKGRGGGGGGGSLAQGYQRSCPLPLQDDHCEEVLQGASPFQGRSSHLVQGWTPFSWAQGGDCPALGTPQGTALSTHPGSWG